MQFLARLPEGPGDSIGTVVECRLFERNVFSAGTLDRATARRAPTHVALFRERCYNRSCENLRPGRQSRTECIALLRYQKQPSLRAAGQAFSLDRDRRTQCRREEHRERLVMDSTRRACLIVGCTVFLAGAAGIVAAGEPGPTRGIKWQPDLHTAHGVAVKEQKPILLVFGAEWCGFCKKLEQTTLMEPDLVKYVNDTFVAVHLDADRDSRACEILEVSSLPCSVVLSADADLLEKFVGYLEKGDYYKKLAAAKQLHARLTRAAASTEPQ
jgi:thiol-disulfide isomerase/thioredoxin